MTDFPATDWFRDFSDELESDSEFQQSMRHFDGAIRLEIGEDVVWMKIYRGQILEVSPQEAEFGSTFSIEAPPSEWERLLTEEKNPFGEQQTLGKIAIGGNALEATRVNGGLNVMVEHLRDATPDTLSLGGEEA